MQIDPAIARLFARNDLERRAVLGSGTILNRSTPVYDVERGEIYRATDDEPLIIPENAVVVPGSRAITSGPGLDWGLSLAAPVIARMPSVYQLMPPRGAAALVNDKLEPLDADLHDPATWDRYGWGPFAPARRNAQVRAGQLAALENTEPAVALGALLAGSPAGVDLEQYERTFNLTADRAAKLAFLPFTTGGKMFDERGAEQFLGRL